jgi:hypothetical protein
MKKRVDLPNGSHIYCYADPPCEFRTCKGNSHGFCKILTDNNFNRPCPFYKRRTRRAT